MNKADIIEQIAQAAEVSKSAAERAVDALVTAVKTSLKKGDMVTLVGFGTFYVGKRQARAGRNPRTGEALKIAAGFRGEEAFEAGVGEDQAFDTVLPWLSEARCIELAKECLELYCWDRLGVEN